MIKEWRILKLEKGYVDIFHCTRSDTLRYSEEWVAYHEYDTNEWIIITKEDSYNYDNQAFIEGIIYCPFCGEEMPDYIKFQAMLLT